MDFLVILNALSRNTVSEAAPLSKVFHASTFFFLIIDLFIAWIFNTTEELEIAIGILTEAAEAETEAYPVAADA